MSASLDDIDEVARATGCAIDARARSQIAAWLELLASWNARLDLTAARSPRELVDLMLADAFVLATRIPNGASVVDVGTGAGAPGMALAIARPDLRVTLCEPLAKRVAFLRTVIGTIGRTDVLLERAKGGALADRAAKFDVAISRATIAPDAWLALAQKLVGPNGSAWVLVARESPPHAAAMTIAEEVTYTLPLTSASRRAIRYAFASSDLP